MITLRQMLLGFLAFLVPGVWVFALGASLMGDEFHFSKYSAALLSAEVWATVRLTLWLAGSALVTAWVLAWIVLSFARSRTRSVLRGPARAIANLPGMMIALLTLFTLRAIGKVELYSLSSVWIAWVFAGFFFLFSGLIEGLSDLDPREREAMQTLGAKPLRAWFHHEYLGTRGLQAALLSQQFFYYLTSFSLVLILNGGPPNETLEVAMYSMIRTGNGDFSKAMALATVQGLILAMIRMLQPNSKIGLGANIWNSGVRGGRGLFWVSIALAFFSLAWSARLGMTSDLTPILIQSFGIAGLVILGVLGYCGICFYSGARFLAGIGAGFSPILASLLIWRAFGLNGGTVIWVALVQVLIFSPGFSRLVFPLLDRVRRAELEAARTLGAGPFWAWRSVEWPRIRGVVLRSLAVVFSFSLTEVTTVMLFSRGDFDTLSTFTQNLFSRFRLEEAWVCSLLLLALTWSGLALAEEVA